MTSPLSDNHLLFLIVLIFLMFYILVNETPQNVYVFNQASPSFDPSLYDDIQYSKSSNNISIELITDTIKIHIETKTFTRGQLIKRHKRLTDSTTVQPMMSKVQSLDYLCFKPKNSLVYCVNMTEDARQNIVLNLKIIKSPNDEDIDIPEMFRQEVPNKSWNSENGDSLTDPTEKEQTQFDKGNSFTNPFGNNPPPIETAGISGKIRPNPKTKSQITITINDGREIQTDIMNKKDDPNGLTKQVTESKSGKDETKPSSTQPRYQNEFPTKGAHRQDRDQTPKVQLVQDKEKYHKSSQGEWRKVYGTKFDENERYEESLREMENIMRNTRFNKIVKNNERVPKERPDKEWGNNVYKTLVESQNKERNEKERIEAFMRLGNFLKTTTTSEYNRHYKEENSDGYEYDRYNKHKETPDNHEDNRHNEYKKTTYGYEDHRHNKHKENIDRYENNRHKEKENSYEYDRLDGYDQYKETTYGSEDNRLNKHSENIDRYENNRHKEKENSYEYDGSDGYDKYKETTHRYQVNKHNTQKENTDSYDDNRHKQKENSYEYDRSDGYNKHKENKDNHELNEHNGYKETTDNHEDNRHKENTDSYEEFMKLPSKEFAENIKEQLYKYWLLHIHNITRNTPDGKHKFDAKTETRREHKIEKSETKLGIRGSDFPQTDRRFESENYKSKESKTQQDSSNKNKETVIKQLDIKELERPQNEQYKNKNKETKTQQKQQDNPNENKETKQFNIDEFKTQQNQQYIDNDEETIKQIEEFERQRNEQDIPNENKQYNIEELQAQQQDVHKNKETIKQSNIEEFERQRNEQDIPNENKQYNIEELQAQQQDVHKNKETIKQSNIEEFERQRNEQDILNENKQYNIEELQAQQQDVHKNKETIKQSNIEEFERQRNEQDIPNENKQYNTEELQAQQQDVDKNKETIKQSNIEDFERQKNEQDIPNENKQYNIEELQAQQQDVHKNKETIKQSNIEEFETQNQQDINEIEEESQIKNGQFVNLNTIYFKKSPQSWETYDSVYHIRQRRE
ncbi:hypothetical protein M8J76_015100 [Diaphorina citri]|nr:hypothetical protein M8J76_015100 [Diaphorina citri]